MSPNQNDLFGREAELGLPLAYEKELRKEGFRWVAGVDEVGRGALAGPVVAAAIILPKQISKLTKRIRDSKKLTAKIRQELDPLIRESALSFGIGIVPPEEIDQMNILRASLKAMQLAIMKLRPKPELCLVDGNQHVPIEIPQRLIIKGDDRVVSIGAASILAKVARDRLMVECAHLHPIYGFSENKGYGTKTHLKALEQNGPCVLHRRTFLRAQVLQKQ